MNLLELFLKHKSVSTDTRNIAEGSIFFALKGPNFNGNKFASEALEKKAAWAVIDEKDYETSNTVLVDNALSSLQILARDYRRHLGIEVIGLTGSNGKTTTKELLTAVLSSKFKTFSTPGNLNNHIGVPLTLLRIPEDTDIAIVEMGDNKPGDIKELCEIAEPSIGFITNVGKDHIEGYGSIEGNLKTKNELFDYLNQFERKGLYSNQDPLVSKIGENLKNKIVIEELAENLNLIQKPSNPFVCFDLDGKTYETKLVGDYNFQNILFAIAIGSLYGVSPSTAADKICEYEPKNNRSQLVSTEKNQVILDAYNANPSSVELALKSFSGLRSNLPKIAILGDMLELGNISKEEHFQVLKNLNIQDKIRPILVGKLYSEFKSDFNFDFFENTISLANHLKENPIKKALVLLKGSRGIKLESLLDSL